MSGRVVLFCVACAGSRPPGCRRRRPKATRTGGGVSESPSAGASFRQAPRHKLRWLPAQFRHCGVNTVRQRQLRAALTAATADLSFPELPPLTRDRLSTQGELSFDHRPTRRDPQVGRDPLFDVPRRGIEPSTPRRPGTHQRSWLHALLTRWLGTGAGAQVSPLRSSAPAFIANFPGLPTRVSPICIPESQVRGR